MALVVRHAEVVIREALTDTRVVLVNGARQVGKSTVVRTIADSRGMVWRSLDDPVAREAARQDPSDFVDLAPMVIDEVQREPDLLLSIKHRVDTRNQSGDFLLTGSARVFGLRGVPDTMPGRVETVELWPFSQGEIGGDPDRFVDAAFALGPDLRLVSSLRRHDYAERVVRGGLPEAVARNAPARRGRFLSSYVTQLIDRDVGELADIEHLQAMRQLVRLVAARSGQPLVPATLANELGIHPRTASRYLSMLELIFMIKLVPAWSRNLKTRVTGHPKVAMVDSGVAAQLVRASTESLTRPEAPMGGLLEGFVLMELARQLSWNQTPAHLYHYRTRDGVEVDALLESSDGKVVAVEVKASSTVRGEDFQGLRHLKQRLGDDFVVGIVLYTGEQTHSFGSDLLAMPLSALWQVGATA
jgi:predicted AAA+ superfamily ATPase